MKNSIDTIWNRTRDLLACSVVPQPNVSLRATVNNMTYLKFKLQLKYANNKNYFYFTVDFSCRLTLKYINLKLKFRKKENYHDRRPMTGTLSPRCC